jgi:alanine dehydrogenase
MDISIPKENINERRVALTPAGVKTLIKEGNTVFIEAGAGEQSGISDKDYSDVGGRIVFSHDEAFKRADIIVKVASPTREEYEMIRDNQIIFSFFHLAVSPKSNVEELLQKNVTAIGYEIVEGDSGDLPVLHTMSEIAGQMSIIVAGRYLESDAGGRGILLGGIPGVPQAVVVILGGGVVGQNATRTALGIGAQVILLDKDINKLREIDKLFEKRVVTSISNEYNIIKAVSFADVLIGAILIHGAKAPKLVTEGMVKTMRPGSVIIDVSIDQGGCIETSRPTNMHDPIFIKHNVIHYCVPNMASNVARTATFALNNVILPYILEVSKNGIDSSIKNNSDLKRGLYTYKGSCVNQEIAETLSNN